MLSFQRYLFGTTARALFVIVATLVVLALLAQGLSSTEIIRENQQSIWIYLKIVMLGAPKVLALLVPMAMFVAAVWSLNRSHRDAEIMVVQATGMTNWQVASPFMRIAAIIVVGHLALNLWVQPAAQRELRETLFDARTDIATGLIRPGQFTTQGALTFYARDRNEGALIGLLISDTSPVDGAIDYLAETGQIVDINGSPALVLQQGQRYERDRFGDLSILDFDQYTFDLSLFLREETDTIYEASDRYLPDLLWPDETNYFDAKSKEEFAAEVHNRLTTPLLSLTMTLLAISAVLGGDYDRQGYGRRIRRSGALAALVLILHIVAHASSENDPAINILQWLIPVSVSAAIALDHFAGIAFRPNLRALYTRLRTSRAEAQAR